jgi:hypothetical protein
VPKADMVKENCTVSGTGSITLTGAMPGYRTFASAFSNGDVVTYAVRNIGDDTWEVGTGTYNSNSISRDTVIASSNSNSPVSFASGTKYCYDTLSASEFSTTSGAGKVPVADSAGAIDSSYLPPDLVAYTYFGGV